MPDLSKFILGMSVMWFLGFFSVEEFFLGGGGGGGIESYVTIPSRFDICFIIRLLNTNEQPA